MLAKNFVIFFVDLALFVFVEFQRLNIFENDNMQTREAQEI